MKLKENFKRFWTLSKNRKGFTLVELIVVIAILAILAGVAIPVYNGYIKKAQEAADNQLMDSINTAFAAACIANGYNHTEAFGQLMIKDDGTILKTGTRPTAAAYIPGSTYYFDVITVTGVATDPTIVIEEAFAMFFAGNETAAFKGEKYVGKTITVTGADDDAAAGGNVVINYGGTTLSVPQAYVDALNKSGFITYDGLGTATLVGKLDKVTDLAQTLTGPDSNGNASDLMNSVYKDAGFLSFMGEALGADLSTVEGQNKVAEEILSKNPGLTVEELKANAAVIYAAQSSANMSQEDMLKLLTDGNGKQTILNNMTAGNTTDAFAQAAIAYGMYTSFAYSEYGSEEAKGKDEWGAMNDLDNEKFKQYLESDAGKADFEGYIAALNMINSTADNSDAMNKLLVNGFGDPDLLGSINDALGK